MIQKQQQGKQNSSSKQQSMHKQLQNQKISFSTPTKIHIQYKQSKFTQEQANVGPIVIQGKLLKLTIHRSSNLQSKQIQQGKVCELLVNIEHVVSVAKNYKNTSAYSIIIMTTNHQSPQQQYLQEQQQQQQQQDQQQQHTLIQQLKTTKQEKINLLGNLTITFQFPLNPISKNGSQLQQQLQLQSSVAMMQHKQRYMAQCDSIYQAIIHTLDYIDAINSDNNDNNNGGIAGLTGMQFMGDIDMEMEDIAMDQQQFQQQQQPQQWQQCQDNNQNVQKVQPQQLQIHSHTNSHKSLDKNGNSNQ